MAVLTVHRPSLAGTPLELTPASVAGDSFPNTGQECVYVVNSGATDRTITFTAPGTCSFGVAHPSHGAVVTVPPAPAPPMLIRAV